MLLLGPDHPTLRETVIAGMSACVDGTDNRRGDPAALGAALSAGWLPKAVPSVEPNEDGVMLAAGPGGLLLAVADGHGGSAAATAALRALAVAAANLLAAPVEGAGCRGGARLVRALAAAAVDGVSDVAEPARTALGLVLAVDESIFSIGYGDTLTALVRRGRPRVISTPSEFLGPGTRGSQDEGRSVERRRRRPGDVVLIVSDGVPDYLGRAFPEAVGAVLRGDGRSAPDAPAVARALVGRAGTAGAGDNITTAVLLPAAAPSWRARLRR
ncbi:protein phosphatase 2C domain-containing protein [Pseudofrankia sp. BMG5.36]|uniref:protein phosphatase 2C domain-containing protein n=1 Tax=Pseudofrankia sp. BMG5.36 TaxID=1834512 RepID=UPI00104243F5|nr:protein phosphatase 2C domain-containing protein [Pseudofrankia sp. BMG5.36]